MNRQERNYDVFDIDRLAQPRVREVPLEEDEIFRLASTGVDKLSRYGQAYYLDGNWVWGYKVEVIGDTGLRMMAPSERDFWGRRKMVDNPKFIIFEQGSYHRHGGEKKFEAESIVKVHLSGLVEMVDGGMITRGTVYSLGEQNRQKVLEVITACVYPTRPRNY